jgi:hypothetical protein
MNSDLENSALIYVLVLNTYLNPGLLSIPLGFSHAGFLLSVIFLLFFLYLSSLLSSMLIETHYKALHLLSAAEEGQQITSSILNLFKPSIKIEPSTADNLLFLDKKIDTFHVMLIILGKPFGTLFNLLMTLTYFLLVTDCYQLFAGRLSYLLPFSGFESCDISSEASYFSQCQLIYSLYLLVFAVFFSYFLKADIKTQHSYQLLSLILKLFILSLVAFSLITVLVSQSTVGTGIYRMYPSLSLFNFGQTQSLILSLSLCLLVQPQLASIFQLAGGSDTVQPAIKAGCLVFLLFSAGLGLLSCIALDNVSADFTESLESYSAGYMWHQRPLYSHLAAYAIMLLPAVSGFSNGMIFGASIYSNGFRWLSESKYVGNNTEKTLVAGITGLPLALAWFRLDLVRDK